MGSDGESISMDLNEFYDSIFSLFNKEINSIDYDIRIGLCKMICNTGLIGKCFHNNNELSMKARNRVLKISVVLFQDDDESVREEVGNHVSKLFSKSLSPYASYLVLREKILEFNMK